MRTAATEQVKLINWPGTRTFSKEGSDVCSHLNCLPEGQLAVVLLVRGSRSTLMMKYQEDDKKKQIILKKHKEQNGYNIEKSIRLKPC